MASFSKPIFERIIKAQVSKFKTEIDKVIEKLTFEPLFLSLNREAVQKELQNYGLDGNSAQVQGFRAAIIDAAIAKGSTPQFYVEVLHGESQHLPGILVYRKEGTLRPSGSPKRILEGILNTGYQNFFTVKELESVIPSTPANYGAIENIAQNIVDAAKGTKPKFLLVGETPARILFSRAPNYKQVAEEVAGIRNISGVFSLTPKGSNDFKMVVNVSINRLRGGSNEEQAFQKVLSQFTKTLGKKVIDAGLDDEIREVTRLEVGRTLKRKGAFKIPSKKIKVGVKAKARKVKNRPVPKGVATNPKMVQNFVSGFGVAVGGYFASTSVLNSLNRQLFKYISRNMGRGSSEEVLNYRTGRFAATARITNVFLDSGFATVDYNYMRHPYATFEPQGKLGFLGKNPLDLLTVSIRQLMRDEYEGTLKRTYVTNEPGSVPHIDKRSWKPIPRPN